MISTENTNILITSAGRRTSLVAAFQKAAHAVHGVVIAADVSPLAPALYLADQAALLPGVKDPRFIEDLEILRASKGIGLVVPTIDTELPVLARARTEFLQRGCVIAISDERVIEITGDKWLTVSEFGNRGVRTPRSYLPAHTKGLDAFPLFIKPRAGSASQHTHRVDSATALSTLLEVVPDPIVQEFLPFEEITVDALLDLNGTPIHYVPRRRIRTLGGESIQGVTLDDTNLRDFILNVLNILGDMGARGPLTLQAFLSPEGPILSEINPRFGGGAPLAFAAGGDYPRWLIEMVQGKTVPPRLGEYTRGLYMTRAYMEVFTDCLVS